MGWLSKLFNLDTTVPSTTEVTRRKATPSGRSSESNSKNEACNRLKLVLMHDRTKLSSETLEQMREELVEVISRYVEIDRDALELNLETDSNTVALVANIPLARHEGGESRKPNLKNEKNELKNKKQENLNDGEKKTVTPATS